MRKNKGSSQNSEAGAALVEFALSVPVLFLFFSGILEFGNTLSQLTWVAQSGYNLVAVGAESPQSTAQALLDARLNQLIEAKDFERFRGRLQVLGVTPAGSDYYNNDPAIRTVSVRLRARIIPISNVSFGIPVDITVTGPQLIENSSYDSDYSNFGQPQPEFLACDGSTAGVIPPTTECRIPCTRTIQMGGETCAWVAP